MWRNEICVVLMRQRSKFKSDRENVGFLFGCLLGTHSSIANSREKMANPPRKFCLEQFCDLYFCLHESG